MVPVTEIRDGRPVTTQEATQVSVPVPMMDRVTVAQPFDAFQAFDTQGRPIPEDRLRARLAKPAIVLTGPGVIPVEPVYLDAVLPSIPLLIQRPGKFRYPAPPEPPADPPANQPIAPVNPQPPILDAEVKTDGLFGFPQAEAAVLHDSDARRVSAWNDAKWLSVQSVLRGDDSNHVGPVRGYQRTSDTSSLYVESDGDPSAAAQGERRYTLNGFPFVLGVRTQDWLPNHNIWSGLIGDGSGSRGAVRYARTPDGPRVRVDSLLIPLDELKVAPGATIRLAVEATSPVPELALKSVESLTDRASFPEYTPGDRPATFDPNQVPDGSKDPILSPGAPVNKPMPGTAPSAPVAAPPPPPWPRRRPIPRPPADRADRGVRRRDRAHPAGRPNRARKTTPSAPGPDPARSRSPLDSRSII